MLYQTETPKNKKPIRVEYIKVNNFKALQNITIKDLTPLTVLLGPNGSGKSTILDVFAFLGECFEMGLQYAWNKRGRAKEIKTRGCDDSPITIEIGYREGKYPLTTYHLTIDEKDYRPLVIEEWLQWQYRRRNRPFRFLEYHNGQGYVIGGELPIEGGQHIEFPLKTPDLLAVNVLGQFAQYPRITALRDFITEWHISHFSANNIYVGQSAEGAQEERLTKTGDNLANVIQHLKEQHPDRLNQIFSTLRRWVPRIESVLAKPIPDGRLLLQVKDTPFDDPILARFASDGALKMLAYLVLLYDPTPPPLIGIENPENLLHPRVLPEFAEECRSTVNRTQLLVATHSPLFLDPLRPEEVRILWRNKKGYTQASRASDLPGIKKYISDGATLGNLWVEGQFGIGDPLTDDEEDLVSFRDI